PRVEGRQPAGIDRQRGQVHAHLQERGGGAAGRGRRGRRGGRGSRRPRSAYLAQPRGRCPGRPPPPRPGAPLRPPRRRGRGRAGPRAGGRRLLPPRLTPIVAGGQRGARTLESRPGMLGGSTPVASDTQGRENAEKVRRRKDPDGRMSLGEHLVELRNRLLISAITVVLLSVVGWFQIGRASCRESGEMW